LIQWRKYKTPKRRNRKKSKRKKTVFHKDRRRNLLIKKQSRGFILYKKKLWQMDFSRRVCPPLGLLNSEKSIKISCNPRKNPYNVNTWGRRCTKYIYNSREKVSKRYEGRSSEDHISKLFYIFFSFAMRFSFPFSSFEIWDFVFLHYDWWIFIKWQKISKWKYIVVKTNHPLHNKIWETYRTNSRSPFGRE
jgi:hypothetical protein